MNDGKICVSVCAETAKEFNKNIELARPVADFIELRFDCLKESEIEKVEFTPDDNYILTFRPKEQGGRRNLTMQKRKDFWNAGNDVWGGDFEEDVVDNSLYCLYQPVICSFHDFSKVPGNLREIYERLKVTHADVLKIAVQTNDIEDSIAVWKLLEKAKQENKQIIPIAMGEAGKWTRILGLAHGAFMTYASLDAGKETASGQFTAKELIETYRVKELNENTEIYGIVGNSVSHSVSPEMHNAAFKFHKINAVYIPFDVKNLGEFIKKFIRKETREVELNFKGFSVTIPHKQEIIEYLDEIDETAKAIGAVNTVKIENGKLYGFNTDAQGFIEPLKSAYDDLSEAKVAVLGAGGAVRACVYALKKENAVITIFARDLRKAKNLADEFQVKLKQIPKTENRGSKIDFCDFDVLINATPIGTKGELENETPAAFADEIKNVSLVYDLVYNPVTTRFLREAQSANVSTVGGLQMLVKQGAAQFKIWTGLDAPADEMNASALRKLKS